MELTADDFLGRWQITREITDFKIMETGKLTGEATFERSGDLVIYAERGTLRFAEGAPLVAERKYLWTFSPDSVDVAFADGRPFHTFELSGAPKASDHLCGEDLYKGGYAFHQWPQWRVVWNVEGPRKKYRSQTFYTPAC